MPMDSASWSAPGPGWAHACSTCTAAPSRAPDSGWPSAAQVAGQHAPVRVVALLAYAAGADRGAQAAARLMQMAAVVEGARAEVVAELGEAPRQLGRRDLPQPELADARGVGHVAAGRPLERMKLGVRRCVSALAAEYSRDLRGRQAESR